MKEEIELERLTYEAAFDELMRIAKSLETEEHSLDETIAMFERGQALSNHCEDLLNQAELKIKTIDGEILVKKEKGKNEF